MAKLLVLNGPNLNLLGLREPETYGRETLQDLRARCERCAAEAGHTVDFFQSNAEHELLEKIHQSMKVGTDFIIINPGAFTHTSIAIRDALLALTCPMVEVHISNVYQRESFRHKSFIGDVVTGRIIGLGSQGYLLALKALAAM